MLSYASVKQNFHVPRHTAEGSDAEMRAGRAKENANDRIKGCIMTKYYDQILSLVACRIAHVA